MRGKHGEPIQRRVTLRRSPRAELFKASRGTLREEISQEFTPLHPRHPPAPVYFSIFVFDKVAAPSALPRFTVFREGNHEEESDRAGGSRVDRKSVV